MKKIKKTTLATLSLLLMMALGIQVQAQNYGKIKGKAQKIGSESGPLDFQEVKLYQGGSFLGTAPTDEAGNYSIPSLEPGEYEVALFVDSQEQMRKTGVKVTSGKTTISDFEVMNSTIGKVVIVPEIEFSVDEVMTTKTYDQEKIEHFPGRQPIDFVMTSSEINAPTGDPRDGFSIRGARTTSTTYFIDGVKVIGPTNMPNRSIGEVMVITGGIPAEYGDVTGGIIAITTRHGMQIPKHTLPVRPNRTKTKPQTKPGDDDRSTLDDFEAFWASSL